MIIVTLRWAVFSIVLLLVSTSASAGVIEGRIAYRKGDYATAKRELEADVQGGAVRAYFLGLMYLHGDGVPKDDARALNLLRTAADDNYAAAQYLLGKRYFYGRGIPRNNALAMSYLLAAAADDDYRAVVFLRTVQKGSGGERKDQERVVAAVKRKARAKDHDAQYTLAFMHLIGDGVPKDAAQELTWYQAAAAKNARAAFMLSLMYYYGDGVAQNPVESVRLMRTAAEMGDLRSQYYLGTFHYHGVGCLEDKPFAAAWFKKSADSGFAEAQLAYGLVLLAGSGVIQDKGKAIEWLGKASQQNNIRAKEIMKELLTYRGQPGSTVIVGETGASSGRRQPDNQLRIEGKGVILDQGDYGLKFSLPNLYDAYAPQNQVTSRSVWEKLQGATFEIVFRPSK